jgi:Na+/glutamate symporter
MLRSISVYGKANVMGMADIFADPGFQLALSIGLACLGFSLALVYGERVNLWLHVRDRAARVRERLAEEQRGQSRKNESVR